MINHVSVVIFTIPSSKRPGAFCTECKFLLLVLTELNIFRAVAIWTCLLWMFCTEGERFRLDRSVLNPIQSTVYESPSILSELRISLRHLYWTHSVTLHT